MHRECHGAFPVKTNCNGILKKQCNKLRTVVNLATAPLPERKCLRNPLAPGTQLLHLSPFVTWHSQTSPLPLLLDIPILHLSPFVTWHSHTSPLPFCYLTFPYFTSPLLLPDIPILHISPFVTWHSHTSPLPFCYLTFPYFTSPLITWHSLIHFVPDMKLSDFILSYLTYRGLAAWLL